MKFRELTPMLWVKDLEATIDFYSTRLGFTCMNKIPGWAILQRDEVDIMLTVPFEEWNFASPQFTGSLYLYVDDVDETWNELKDMVEIFYPIENFDYGMREFAIRDCNGYIIQFGKEI